VDWPGIKGLGIRIFITIRTESFDRWALEHQLVDCCGLARHKGTVAHDFFSLLGLNPSMGGH
jgi:hypothetical protein